MTESKTRLGVSAFAIVAFVLAFGSNGVRYIVGLPAFFVIAGLLTVASIVVFIRLKPARFRWYRLPAPIYWFLILAILSIFWSSYRLESIAGVAAQLATTFIAVMLAFAIDAGAPG